MKKKIFTLLVLFLSFMGLKAQQPYIGEIRMFAGNYAPNGWAICDGSLISIADNDVLFALIGTTYGGDGQTTFALPDLRGRAPIHQGNGYVIGQMGGTETVTLTANQIQSHTHAGSLMLGVSNQGGNVDTPVGNVTAVNPARGKEFSTVSNGTMALVGFSANAATSAVGGNQPHENMKPFVAVNYIISLYGIFPTQN